MLCVTPNFSTNAYLERMYENPVKIQHNLTQAFKYSLPYSDQKYIEGDLKSDMCTLLVLKW